YAPEPLLPRKSNSFAASNWPAFTPPQWPCFALPLTILLFFDRSGPTKDVWYYEHQLPEGKKNYTKTSPLQFEEFRECLAWWKKREENARAWKVAAKELLAGGCNLDRKNPSAKEDITHLPPQQLADSIVLKQQRIAEIMSEIKTLLGSYGA
ncbi:MAG: N-6 DNA methylase, partial [Sulfobacillus sp.]